MKFSIGDKILLRRTGEEGRVVAFLSKTMMEVEVGGVHFPVYNDEVEHPYLKWFTEGAKKAAQKRIEDIPVEKIKARPQRLARGIYLSFIPQFSAGITEDIIEAFRIHLINESPDDVAFSYHVRTANAISIFQLKGTLHAFGNLYLHPVSLEELNAQPRLHWDLIPASGKHAKGVRGVVRIRGAQLARYIRRLLEENEPSFSVLLAQDAEGTAAAPEPGRLLPDPEVISADTSGPQVTMHTKAEAVVDLHIAGLMQDTDALSPEEILRIQLSHLSQKLQAAIVAHYDHMIIIHGIGGGGLKEKVHALLASMTEVRSFSNRWMGAYGWGATEVIF